MTDLAGHGVRALVIGTATHTGTALPPVPAAAPSARAFAAALTGVCGVAPTGVRLMINPPDARGMAEAVAEAADQATSVLLIYFVGHGLLDETGELHLAATGTGTLTPGLSGHQALAWSAVQKALSGSTAATIVLILDCCFSGRARTPGTSGPVGPGFIPPPAHGAYVFASAEGLASAPPYAELTAFTGELVSLLEKGDERAGRRLTLDVVYDRLLSRLRAAGAPLPRRQSGDTSGSLVLAENRAQPPEPAGAEPPAEGTSPYLGLASFGAEDADLYFGREALTRQLLAAAAEARNAGRPLIVVGASGSGKSSLVQAGLVAAVHRGDLDGSEDWPVVVLTPGRPTTLGDLRAVVVVDQLEQLFALRSPQQRADFLAAIPGLATRHLVVLALRADFYAQAAEQPELRAALDHQFLVTPMSAGELRSAIEEPARARGLRLEGALADVILHELGAGSRLPLLSHALWATWRNRSGTTLTLKGYDDAGRIDRAVATSADEVYEALDEPSREAVRRMLPHLVQVGEENPDTVRPAGRDELLHALPDPEAGSRALEAFTAARLITQDRDTVRLSHEALLRIWPRLVTWLDEDRDWLRTSQRLATDAAAWRSSGRDNALAYRGSRLAAARDGAREHPRLPPDSADFLAASERLERRSARIRRAVIASLTVLAVVAAAATVVSLVAQRRATTQRDRALARAISADVARLAPGEPGLAKQLAAVAYRLAPEVGSGTVLTSVGLPGQFAVQQRVADLATDGAGRIAALATGDSVLLWDLTAGAQLSRVGDLFTGPVAISPDGTLLAAAAGPVSGNAPTIVGTVRIELPRPDVRLWDIRDPRHPAPLPTLASGAASITTLAFSPDGRMLAGAGTGGLIHRWDATDHTAVRPLPALAGHTGRVDSVAFSPDSRLLASSGRDGTARLWDVADPARPVARARLAGSTADWDNSITAIQHRVAFDPTGRRLAIVIGKDSEAPDVYDVSDPRHPRLHFQQHTSDGCHRLYALAFQGEVVAGSCDTGARTWVPGKDLASATRDQTILDYGDAMPVDDFIGFGPLLTWPGAGHTATVLVAGGAGVLIWDISDARRAGALTTLNREPTGASIRVQFNPTGPRLMADSSGYAGTLVYDVADPRHPRLVGSVRTTDPVDSFYGNDAGSGVAFSPDGTVLAATKIIKQRPYVVLLSTADPGGPPIATITDLEYGASALSFSADRKLLAIADIGFGPGAAPPSVKIFDLSDLAHPRRVGSFEALTWKVAFAPKGRTLAAFTSDDVLLRDLTDPARPRPLRGFHFPADDSATNGVFTPDGNWMVVADQTRLIRFFQLDDGGLVPGPVQAIARGQFGNSVLAISPDGLTLALPGTQQSKQVDLWAIDDPRQARVRTSLTVHESGVAEAVAFSADGTILAVRNGDLLDLWSVDAAAVAGDLCRLVGDPITRAQWQLYLSDLPYDPPCD
ncbi:WD40 repeat domain-containing protein [Paractinoplanes globisporus]|uniref:Caspase family protein n=1 Tax=Paractinoplanes globisporus TaxID=113565 RepID=A0ABW6W8R0_9ACTN|nr:WD40 repeat domain-containing protein [Actinoplanes globisporus]